MRIRLLVPKDGKQMVGKEGVRESSPSGGLRSWFHSLFSPSRTAPPPAAPPSLDHRWHTCGSARYHFIGRRCRFFHQRWQSEYTFDVLSGAQLHQLRIILAEPLVAAWENEHRLRMSEELRLRLATDTMEAFVGLARFPASATVSAEAVKAAVPTPL